MLQLQQPVRRGDGIVFDAGRPQEAEQGGAVYDILPAGGGSGLESGSPGEGAGTRKGSITCCVLLLHHCSLHFSAGAHSWPIADRSPAAPPAAGDTVQLVFGRGALDLRAVRPGDLIWKNRDPALERRLRASYEALPAASQRRLPVAVAVQAALGTPLRVTLTDEQVGRGGAGGQGAGGGAAGCGLQSSCFVVHQQLKCVFCCV